MNHATGHRQGGLPDFIDPEDLVGNYCRHLRSRNWSKIVKADVEEVVIQFAPGGMGSEPRGAKTTMGWEDFTRRYQVEPSVRY